MDRQAWIAIALCIAGLIGWQVYMVKHPAVPPAKVLASPSPASTVANTSSPGASPGSTESRLAGAVSPNEPTPAPKAAPFVEKTTTLRNADLELLLTNRGGGIADAILPRHKGENGAPVKLNPHPDLPIGAIIDKPAAPLLEEFTVTAGEGNVQFERALPNNVMLRKKFSLSAPPNGKDNYVAQMEVNFQNSGPAVYTNPGFYVALGSAAPIHHNDLPNYTRVTWCMDGKTKTTDVSWFAEQNYPLIGVQKRAAQQFFEEKINNAEWLGVSNQFFATLVTPISAKSTSVWAQRFESFKKPDGSLEYGIEGAMGMPGFKVQPGQTATALYQLYIGPKLYNRLAQLTHDEAEIMDFGLWKLVSQTLLNMMNLIHRFVGNYAVAILILTAIIKLILWPLQTKANKSMRRMAALSPKMQELREKFKDDPTKMNAEVMKL
ncbi:MAG: membrane protein insertase YidC, partial [Spartobacteria bacterium]